MRTNQHVGDTNDMKAQFKLYRPCCCGCDGEGIGYIHGRYLGKYVTVWIETEEVYQELKNHMVEGEDDPIVHR